MKTYEKYRQAVLDTHGTPGLHELNRHALLHGFIMFSCMLFDLIRDDIKSIRTQIGREIDLGDLN